MSQSILVQREGPVATVLLNRPERLNALDLASWRRLGEVAIELDKQDDLRCIVIRGAGEKAFAAGADISAFARERADVKQARLYGETVHQSLTAVSTCRHPTVAMIRGVCVGGGLELACCCDLRIAGEDSRFGVPIKQLGLTMTHGELKALIDLVGKAGALEILLEGAIFGAEHALRLGLVTRVVPDAELDREVAETVARIAEGAPLVARWHKKFIRRLLDPTPLSAEEVEEGFAAMGTEDYRRGVAAFLAKRKPEFTGS
jgi:enoyl-CoA hydratase/carnithine racemase